MGERESCPLLMQMYLTLRDGVVFTGEQAVVLGLTLTTLLFQNLLLRHHPRTLCDDPERDDQNVFVWFRFDPLTVICFLVALLGGEEQSPLLLLIWESNQGQLYEYELTWPDLEQ